MNRADEIRALADSDELAAVIAAFPAVDEIPPRALFSPAGALERLADDPARRVEQLAERMETWGERLCKDVQRYERLRSAGLAALSDYDLTIAYRGDAIAAISGALKLKATHVSHARGVLLLLLVEQAATAAALEAARPQLALF